MLSTSSADADLILSAWEFTLMNVSAMDRETCQIFSVQP